VFQPDSDRVDVALRECEADTRKICAVYQKRRDVLVAGSNALDGRGEATRLDVPVGAAAGALRELGSFEFSKLLMEKALVAVSRASDSGRWAKATCGSRWSKTSSASGRPRGPSDNFQSVERGTTAREKPIGPRMNTDEHG